MKSILFGLSFVATAIAGANDGWWASTGAMGGFGKHENIQMVEEDISIKLLPEFAEVEVDFLFKNHGPATTVTMGFPEEHAVLGDSGMRKFRSWVDGREVKTRRQMTLVDKEFDHWKSVWLKEVEFDEGQTKRVRVTYEGRYGGNTGGQLGLSYVMRTGSTWKSPIERCRISVDWSSWDLGPPIIEFVSERLREGINGTKPSRHSFEAELHDFTPDFDLHISFATAFWNFEIDRKRVSTDGYFRQPVDRRDPIVYSETVGIFFGAEGEEDWESWMHPSVQKFGGPFEILGSLIRFESGKTKRLSRGPVIHEDREYVYLSDLVQALGGTYEYDEQGDIGRISFQDNNDAPTTPVTSPKSENRMNWIAPIAGGTAFLGAVALWLRRKPAGRGK
jgi:hypothetical protein